MASFTLDLRDPAFVDDPYPFYRRLRDEAPAYQDPDSGLWFVTRYADVERATLDYHSFSSARGNVVIDSPTRVGKTLGSLDPPRHDELRRVIQRSLGVARIDAVLPLIRRETIARIDAFSAQRQCDLIKDIAQPVLFGALGRMLGLDPAASEHAAKLIDGLFHQDEGLLGAVLQPNEFQAIAAFLAEELGKRRIEADDDLFSVLLTAKKEGAPLNDAEIVANLSTVLMAGSASIGHFFPNLMHSFWLHPEQRKRVRDDLSRIPAAIEEAVRWDTSTQCFARHITQDTDVSGSIIPADSRAIIFYASANRDDRVIQDADRFDIDRKRVRHFGFGMGPHICAGANAARAMLRAMLEEMLPLLGDYTLDMHQAGRAGHIMVRGFITLPIHW